MKKPNPNPTPIDSIRAKIANSLISRVCPLYKVFQTPEAQELFFELSENQSGELVKKKLPKFKLTEIFVSLFDFFYDEATQLYYVGTPPEIYEKDNNFIEINDRVRNEINTAFTVISELNEKNLWAFIESESGSKTINSFQLFFLNTYRLYKRHESDPITDLIKSMPLRLDYSMDVLKAMNLPAEPSDAWNFLINIFKKWFVGVIRQVFENDMPNNLVPLLIGGVGKAKTSFFTFLTSDYKNPSKTFTVHKRNIKVNFDGQQKDLYFRLTQNIIGLVDDMSPFDVKLMAAFRQITSLNNITERKAYGRYDSNLKRYMSFCATSNHQNIIRETHNNRRFIPFEYLEGENLNTDLYNNVPKTDVWGEAMYCYKNGFDCDLTRQEIEFVGKLSVFYSANPLNPILEELYRVIQKSKANENCEWLTVAKIYDVIVQTHPYLKNHLSIPKIELSLHEIGYFKDNRNRYLVEILARKS